MSGAVRSVLALGRNRARHSIGEVPDQISPPDASLTFEEKLKALEEQRLSLEYNKSKLEKAINFLKDRDKIWMELIDSLTADDKEEEIALHKVEVDKPEGHWNLIFLGEDKVSQIDTMIASLDRTLAILRSKLSISQQEGEPAVVTVSAEGQRQLPVYTAAATGGSAYSVMQLPKMSLPECDGSYVTFPSYIDIFESTVHRHPHLSNAQKMTYLKSSLKGAAAEAIKAIPISHENYERALEILKSRFGNKRAIKEALYAQFRELGKSKSSLKAVISDAENILHQLTARGHDTKQPVFVELLKQSLPSWVIMELDRWRPSSDDEEWQISDLLTKLWKLVRTQEECQRRKNFDVSSSYSSPKSSEVSRERQMPYRKAHYTTEALATCATGARRDGPRERRPCIFCEGSHFDEECQVIKTVEARQAKLRQMRLCFVCLSPGHEARNCRVSDKPCYHCQRRGHHRSICFKLSRSRGPPREQGLQPRVGPPSAALATEANEIKSSEPREYDTGDNTTNLAAKITRERVGKNQLRGLQPLPTILMSARAVLKNPENPTASVTASIVLDTASQRCFCTKGVASSLKLSRLRDPLSLNTLATERPKSVQSSRCAIDIVTRDGSTFSIEANVLDRLTGSISRAPLTQADLKFLESIPQGELADDLSNDSPEVKPDLIIGAEYMWDLLSTEKRQKLPSGLHVIPSLLGLIITGAQFGKRPNADGASSVALFTGIEVQAVESQWEEFESLQSAGIKDCPIKDEDKAALEHFNSTVQFNEETKRYAVCWPPNGNALEELPTNYGLALGRMKSLQKRLKMRENTKLLAQYDAIIKDQLEKGVVEIVTKETPTSKHVHYLAHHPVITPQKETTKVRLVYDASARCSTWAKSLNDCLYQGPLILPDLTGLLLRFREDPIAMLADLEKAFLQVELQEMERDLTRFFWFADAAHPDIDKLLTLRFRRVPFGVTSSPFLLCRTVQYHLEKSESEMANLILQNIYVDNVLVGLSSIDEARKFYGEAKSLFQEASFNLREWASNSREVMTSIPEADRVKEQTSIKVLGLHWNYEEDKFFIGNPKIDENQIVTKRTVLSNLSSIFDPLGLLAPVVLAGKLFVKELWEEYKQWDEALPLELAAKWREISHEYKCIPELVFDRYLGMPKDAKLTLHAFVDASQKAFATAIYLHIEHAETLKTELIFAKTRIAPKKCASIPRLELLAIWMGVKAVSFVQVQMKSKISAIYIWSDSQCCLYWLRSAKRLAVFVQNRLDEVRRIAAQLAIKFRYIASHENPADVATHGCSVKELATNTLWWEGPEWLARNDWPPLQIEELTPEILQETQKETRGPMITLAAVSHVAQVDTKPRFGIDISRFSTLTKLHRATAYWLRFLSYKVWEKLSVNTKVKYKSLGKLFEPFVHRGRIVSEEIEVVKYWWLRETQHSGYTEVLSAVAENKKHPLKSQLGLIINERGLLVCHGRLQNAELPESARFPILLCKRHPYTRLLIEHAHRKLQHSGVKHTLAELRQQYWVPQGKSAVQTVLSNCMVCRKLNSAAYKLPPMAPLPKCRVGRQRVFQNVGVDYFGPLWVKNDNYKSKRWVALFTCTASRNIQMEIVRDVTTTSFIDALRRFIARRGKPDQITSDNAQHFKLASKALKVTSIYEIDEEVLDYCATHEIRWHFIPEYAPWMGGFYERLIGLVKSSMKKAIGRSLLSDDQLATLLCETEAIVNSRPLGSLENDVESNGIIRPIDILIPHAQIGTIRLRDEDEDSSDPDYMEKPSEKDRLLQSWKDSQKHIDQFWQQFYRDYLLGLRETHTMLHKTPRSFVTGPPKVGEIVQIKDAHTPRGRWLLGKITGLNYSNDGEVRTVKLALPNRKTATKPITLLYPLEITG